MQNECALEALAILADGQVYRIEMVTHGAIQLLIVFVGGAKKQNQACVIDAETHCGA